MSQGIATFIYSLLTMIYVQAFSLLALIPVGMYNQKQGLKLKRFLYIFYPGHLLILFIVQLVNRSKGQKIV